METIDKLSNGFFSSSGFKLALIGFLTLLLLIPATMILELIREREGRRNETVNEVSSLWGNAQTLTGPFLTIPYEITTKSGKDDYTTITNYAHFLPEDLKIEGLIEPMERNRGIYKVITYNTRLHVSGKFAAPDLAALNIPASGNGEIQAFIEIGIPDMRGINKDIRVNFNSREWTVIPGLKNNDIAESGVHSAVILSNGTDYSFSFDLDLNGSQSLNFIPLGKETNVHLSSPWAAPSFSGAFIPDDRKVNDDGFNAWWNVLQLNRNFPQQWVNNEYSVDASSFGVELITPVDTYQKSERSVKYAILFIGLTFVVFFFAEVMTKTRMHAVNYLLSGFALCVFYSLLTALAEHIHFTLAYIIAAVTIISMITAFSHSLYKLRKVTQTVMASLVILYGFLFVILQLTDYALLLGNIGIVIILAIVMYFSRKIDWYATAEKAVN